MDIYLEIIDYATGQDVSINVLLLQECYVRDNNINPKDKTNPYLVVYKTVAGVLYYEGFVDQANAEARRDYVIGAGGGSTPSGNIEITTNGTYSVSQYATASVDVPQPSGTINITTNGTHDVTNYVSAKVKVSSSVPDLQDKTVIPSTSDQEITADEGYDGLGTVTVEGYLLQDKTVTPTTSEQEITAGQEYDALGTVTVSAVTSAIDQNIVAGNIKKDVSILGVTGTLESGAPTPSNMSAFNTQLQSLETAYHSQFSNSVTSRQVKDQNAVTLYTPDTGHTKYLIINGTSSTFGATATAVFWYPSDLTYLKVIPLSTYPNDGTVIYPVFENAITTKTADNTYTTTYQLNEETYKTRPMYSATGSYNMYSATIEDAISALESSETRWKSTAIDINNSGAIGKWDAVTYISNVPIIDSTNSLFTGNATFYRISADETITTTS